MFGPAEGGKAWGTLDLLNEWVAGGGRKAGPKGGLKWCPRYVTSLCGGGNHRVFSGRGIKAGPRDDDPTDGTYLGCRGGLFRNARGLGEFFVGPVGGFVFLL